VTNARHCEKGSASVKSRSQSAEDNMGILWTIIMGAVVGAIAKFVMPGSNEPKGFILTAALGIAGSLLAGFLGQAIGWYSAGQGAGFFGSLVGAIILIVVYGIVTKPKA
jgi:uncharacterized membrane protein YeaQ/YmgE (transglycosylase-associated protein family)